MESDWDKVTYLRKKKPSVAPHTPEAINEAIIKGSPIEIIKKYNAGTNKPHGTNPEAQRIAKSDDILAPTIVSHDIGRIIMRARQEASLTQKELAAKICEKPDIIHNYEMGKGVLNPTILGKLERILGVKLRGSNIGTPLKSNKT